MSQKLVVSKVWFSTTKQSMVDDALKIASDNAGDVSLTIETQRVGRFLPRTQATLTFNANTSRGNDICEDIARQVGQL